MYSFIARQPIFDKNMRTVAYELLFRDGLNNTFPNVSSEVATAQVISDQFLCTPLSDTDGEHTYFINFPYQMLIHGLADSLPQDKVVIEILENATPDDLLYDSVVRLYNSGYRIALDDFIPDARWERFFPYIKVIKFDIRQTPLNEIGDFIYKQYNTLNSITYLAEKIETYDEFEQCKRLGFSLFQGYFYSRPELVKNKRLSQNASVLFQLVMEVNTDNPDYSKIESILGRDLSLSYKIMRYVKNVMPRLGQSENTAPLSLKDIAIYLGKNELSRFVSVMCMTNSGTARVDELYTLSLVRARFCELISRLNQNYSVSQDAFYCGLFSMLDVILEIPLEDLFSQIVLSRDVKDALLTHTGVLSQYLTLAKSYERHDWLTVKKINKELGVTDSEVIVAMRHAVNWADDCQAS